MKNFGYINNNTYLWACILVCYIGCAKTAFSPAIFRQSSVHCLRDYIINEDAGGTWTQVGNTPQNIGGFLVGDNPCIEWGSLACGQYTLKYKVGAACCQDSVIISPIKCCLVGSSTCN